MILSSITEAIGNTPLLKIPESVHGIMGLEVYAKCEFLNPFGSVKDRTALGLLSDVKHDTDIIESSSGNTAKALGVLASLRGISLVTVTNRIRFREVEDVLRIIGVDIESLPPGSECPNPNDPTSPFTVIQKYLHQYPDTYTWTDQYTNQANTQVHHDTTAREIDTDMGIPDYFFSGLGTTGSSGGIIRYFSEKGGCMKSIGIVTAPGSYIPGIRNTREMADVGLFQKKMYDEIVSVSDQDAIDAVLLLVRQCGMLVGPTTGAVFHGMMQVLKQYDSKMLLGKKVVFIACDRIESYIGYFREKRSNLFQDTKTEHLEQNEAIEYGEIKYINKSDLNHKEQFLVDMRSYLSYDLGHIEGSISFPFHALQEYVQKGYLPFPPEKPIVFICPYGEESELMAQIAGGMGYDAYSLEGGYVG